MRWSLLMRQLRPIQLHMLIAFLLIQDGDQCGEYHGPVLFFERTTWKYAVQKEWSGSRERAKLQTASSYSNSRHGTTAFCVSLLKTINLVGVSWGVRSIKLDDYTFEEFGLDERKLSSVCSWCCRELESFVFLCKIIIPWHISTEISWRLIRPLFTCTGSTCSTHLINSIEMWVSSGVLIQDYI